MSRKDEEISDDAKPSFFKKETSPPKKVSSTRTIFVNPSPSSKRYSKPHDLKVS